MTAFEDSLRVELYVEGNPISGLRVEQLSLLTDVVQFESRMLDNRLPSGQSAGMVLSLPINQDLKTPKQRDALSCLLRWYQMVKSSTPLFCWNGNKGPIRTKADNCSILVKKNNLSLQEIDLRGVFPSGIEIKSLHDPSTAKVLFYFSVDSYSIRNTSAQNIKKRAESNMFGAGRF
jgi:hypothetical protein